MSLSGYTDIALLFNHMKELIKVGLQMGKYEYVLERLVQFRKSLNLTQVQMAEKLNIGQEQYSYLENGKVKITAELLQALNGLGLDINYLITGEYNDICKNMVFDMFESVTNEEYRKKMKRLMIYLLNIVFIKDTTDETAVGEEQSLLMSLEKYGEEFSMLLYVREKLNLSQIAMADELGLGIKKYRKLEKELIYPDAELLFVLWQKSNCPPVLFLDLCDRELYIIDLFWNELSKEQRIKIEDIFHEIEQCCKKDLLQ